MRLVLAVLPLAVLAAAPASASAAVDLATTATVTPSPAQTAQQVTITITTTNLGEHATVNPVYQRMTLTTEQGFGADQVNCGTGTQTNPASPECLASAPVQPGASVTMTVTGFSPNAGTTPFTATGFTYGDANPGNDNHQGQIVVEGLTNDGSGVLGDGPAPGQATSAPFVLARPTVTRRVRSGKRLTVRATVDRRAELGAVVEKRGKGGKWKKLRGGPRTKCRADVPCVLRFAQVDGKVLTPGAYRLALIATDQRGERAVSPKVRFQVVKRR